MTHNENNMNHKNLKKSKIAKKYPFLNKTMIQRLYGLDINPLSKENLFILLIKI